MYKPDLYSLDNLGCSILFLLRTRVWAYLVWIQYVNSNDYKVVMLGDRYRVVSKQKYGDFNF